MNLRSVFSKISITDFFIFLLIFVSYFFNGLYYSFEKSFALILSSVIVVKKLYDNKVLKISLDYVLYSLLAIIFIIFSGFFYYTEKGMGIYAVNTFLLFLLFYVLVDNLEQDEILFISRLLVIFALINIAFSALFINSNLVYKLGYISDGELAGALQYGNSYAILLLMLVHFCFKERFRYRYFIILILILAIIFTKSKSGILFLLFYLLYFAIKNVHKNLKMLTVLAFTFFQVIAVVNLTNFYDIGTVINSYNPFYSSSFLTRLLYYKDALNMIKHNFFGYGYMGYYFAQHYFQTGYDYTVKYVHSAPLQMILDYGIIAFVFLIIIVFNAFQYIKREDKVVFIIFIIASFIDFHIQFGLFVLMIFILTKNKRKTIVIKNNIFFGILVSGFVIFSTYVFASDIFYYAKDYDTAVKIYKYNTIAYKKNSDYFDEENLKRLSDNNNYLYFCYKRLADKYLQDGRLEEAYFYSGMYRKYNPLGDFKESFHLKTQNDMLKCKKDVEIIDEIKDYYSYVQMLKDDRSTRLEVNHRFDFELDDVAKNIIGKFKNVKD